ncbi:MAG: sulfurtransferase [Saprospiraceae bacterium]
MPISPLITIEELLLIYKNSNVLIFDASSGKDAQSNYEKEHLEGAFFIDLNTQLAEIQQDLSLGGRHPLPSTADFSRILTEFGVTKNTHIIIYDDNNGSNASARFWWMLKSAGHAKVQVLNGGLNSAKKKHFPMTSHREIINTAAEPYPIQQWLLPTITLNKVERISENPDYLVIDVRDKIRYDGIYEPIDLIAGHIPGAINIPYSENLDEEGLFLSPAVLKEKYNKFFEDKRPENTIIHCGSGVTACHTLLALDYAGLEIPRLYVGSWSEWSRNNKKIAKTEI